MTKLHISDMDMVFPTPQGPFCALKDIELKISEGEFVSLIGHSGCGKSTVLNVVAGLYEASRGGVLLNDKEVNAPGPESMTRTDSSISCSISSDMAA